METVVEKYEFNNRQAIDGFLKEKGTSWEELEPKISSVLNEPENRYRNVTVELTDFRGEGPDTLFLKLNMLKLQENDLQYLDALSSKLDNKIPELEDEIVLDLLYIN